MTDPLWSAELPFALPSLNKTRWKHWRTQKASDDEIKESVGWTLKSLAAAISGPVAVKITVFLRDDIAEKSDAENLETKPLIDTMVKEFKMFPDDNARFIRQVTRRIEPCLKGDERTLIEIFRDTELVRCAPIKNPRSTKPRG
jgi:hypothetical protein